jgi:hypothetical protein
VRGRAHRRSHDDAGQMPAMLGRRVQVGARRGDRGPRRLTRRGERLRPGEAPINSSARTCTGVSPTPPSAIRAPRDAAVLAEHKAAAAPASPQPRERGETS